MTHPGARGARGSRRSATESAVTMISTVLVDTSTEPTHRQARDELLARQVRRGKQSGGAVGDFLDRLHDPLAVSRVCLHLASHPGDKLLGGSRHLCIGEQESNRFETMDRRVAPSAVVQWLMRPSSSATHPRNPVMPPGFPFIALEKLNAPPLTATALSIPLGFP